MAHVKTTLPSQYPGKYVALGVPAGAFTGPYCASLTSEASGAAFNITSRTLFPHLVPIRSMMDGKSRPWRILPAVMGENGCSHNPFLRGSLSKGGVMPRYLSEVKGKEFPAITEFCLEWLMREWVASGEFQDARTQTYAYFQAATKDPHFREVFHLMFGPALYRFVMRVWAEGDKDVRTFMERKRR